MSKHSQVYLQSLLKKQLYGLFLFIWFFNASHMYAAWDPRSLCALEENKPLDGLQDPSFQSLKKQVFQYLKNSWCSAKKAELMMDLVFLTHPQVCVEIGAFSGSSVLPLAATLKYLKQGHIYAIDAWSNDEAVKHISVNDPNYAWWSRVNMPYIKNQFNILLNQWWLGSYCSVIHASSEIAVDQMPEIDFLHLDGNFSEEGSLLDTQLFLPKVKSGGYILLSNLFALVDGKRTKMASMWRLFDQCEIICEMDNYDAALFRKN